MNHVIPWAMLAIASSAAAVDDTEPIVDKAQLFANLDSMTDGTQVWLEDVVVREKSGNVLRISDRTHRMFVVPVDPSLLDFLAIGTHVDIRGTLRRTPSAGQARLSYAMSRGAAWRMSRDRFCVDAWSVEPAT